MINLMLTSSLQLISLDLTSCSLGNPCIHHLLLPSHFSLVIEKPTKEKNAKAQKPCQEKKLSALRVSASLPSPVTHLFLLLRCHNLLYLPSHALIINTIHHHCPWLLHDAPSSNNKHEQKQRMWQHVDHAAKKIDCVTQTRKKVNRINMGKFQKQQKKKKKGKNLKSRHAVSL